MLNEPIFLEIEEILAFHKVQISVFGGSYGIRDISLLESAIAMPKASFGSQYLHQDISEMAAAYLYHIIKNHAFVDGNKRIGVLVMIAFLKINNYTFVANQKEVFELATNVASSKLSKEELVKRIKIFTNR